MAQQIIKQVRWEPFTANDIQASEVTRNLSWLTNNGAGIMILHYWYIQLVMPD